MATQKKKGRLIRNLFYFLSLLVTAGVCYIAILMLSGQFEDGLTHPPAEDAALLQPGQTVRFADLQETFGAPLPQLPGYPMQGQALNVPYNGKSVRKAVQQYEGFTLSAVQPAFASPLLLHPELSLSMETDYSVAGLPAALAEGENEYCFYFSTEEAAYSLHAQNMDRENFLALAALISFPNE